MYSRAHIKSIISNQKSYHMWENTQSKYGEHDKVALNSFLKQASWFL